MKKFISVLFSIFVLLLVVASCSPEPEKAEANTTVVQTSINQYDDTTKYGCRHFKSLIANAEVTTYQEQLSEMKKVYTAMAVAYEDGNYQSGPMYYAARIAYSASIDNNFDAEAEAAMLELYTLCSKVPNW
jgi:ABC-type Zn uptake system ZnuABC Zn-binding protein ZnuA